MYFFHLLTRVIIPILSVVFLVDAAKLKKKTSNPYYGHQNAGYEAASSKEDEQDLSGIPGQPGVDYPLYHSVPETNFNCGAVPYAPGMYANVETGCQAYHVCHDGREGHQGASFLCSNGTLFNQKEFTCDYWYNVDCGQAESLYRLNADPETNPFNPKQKTSEETVDTDAYKATPQYYKPTPQYYQPTPQYVRKSPSQYYKPAPTPYSQPTLPQQYYQPSSDY
ncbi:uncharacterized protein LOC135849974 [Planococcus citri]|uniref:uncharacterized protein LOC135849974 n=1 Tax=Planococcus citri TaxID=170843 RepID=UPI0031F90ACF